MADPNQLIKLNWPSTHAWWNLVSLAARVSPDFASQMLTEIPDPEIATLEKVEFGKTLLGSPSDLALHAQERHRDRADAVVPF